MTIQTIINDGLNVRHRTYRKVYRMGGYGEMLRGFLDSANYSKWGEMWQLKGNKRILIARYGVK